MEQAPEGQWSRRDDESEISGQKVEMRNKHDTVTYPKNYLYKSRISLSFELRNNKKQYVKHLNGRKLCFFL